MSYPKWFDEIVCDPETKEKLKIKDGKYSSENGREYFFSGKILSIVFPQTISGEDARMNKFYDYLAPFYSFTEEVMGRIITGVDIKKGREKIISLLELQKGMRLLEVSPGPGVFQKLLRNEIGNIGGFVALDLSLPMLRQCQIKNRSLNIQLVHANAQYLPFTDGSFDAVFHFGGINLFNDPDKAIKELIRVVKKRSIVSWGDEGFSSNYQNGFRKKLLSKINPGFLKTRPSVPKELTDIKEYEVYNGLAYLVAGRKK